ncbi:MAG: hypothetical protein JJU45_06185 [Acidimicrobiia bacterium]|nr:hypothetical protein [Acidimicrobiia bacterium]
MKTDDEERLRRELRATTAVNRQLLAQSGGGNGNGKGSGRASTTAGGAGVPAAPRIRREGVARTWLTALAELDVSERPFLVRPPKGPVTLVEGGTARPVTSSLLVATLERTFGEPRPVSDAELAKWSDGVPVEVLEGPRGAPFIIVAGTRHKLRGLPVPYPVSTSDAEMFPSGPVLNVARSNVSRLRYRRAMKGSEQRRWLADQFRAKSPRQLLSALIRRLGR